MSALTDLVQMLKNEKKSTGSDYTATVTRVDGGTAYVRITGADIMDTPVTMSINCKAGDKVRVRVANGKAWITGNDTAPPTNDTETIKKARNDLDGLSKRIKKIEGGIKIEGVVHFTDLENPDEETVIKGGNIDATSMAIKEAYSMYNGAERQRIMAFDKTEPFPGVESFMVVIDPDENIPNCYINTGNTWVKALSASLPNGAGMTMDEELFYVDMPVYDSNYEPTGAVTRVLQVTPSYNGSASLIQSPAINDRVWALSANVGINSVGTLYKVSSSRRYKYDIEDIDLEEVLPLLNLKVRKFKYNTLPEDDEKYGKSMPGFISEEVNEILPIAVDHDQDGNCEMWNSNVIVPCLLKLIQDQEKRIAALEAEIKEISQ